MILDKILYDKFYNNGKIVAENYDYYKKVLKKYPKQFRVGQAITLLGFTPITYLALNLGFTGSYNMPSNIAMPLLLAGIPVVAFGYCVMAEGLEDYVKFKHAKYTLKKLNQSSNFEK